jgi:hypothetical protein
LSAFDAALGLTASVSPLIGFSAAALATGGAESVLVGVLTAERLGRSDRSVHRDDHGDADKLWNGGCCVGVMGLER